MFCFLYMHDTCSWKVHKYIHTYIHTYVHTYIHACMHTCMHTQHITCTSMPQCTYLKILKYIHTCMHACIHTYTAYHLHKHAPMHVRQNLKKHDQMRIEGLAFDAYIHTCMHACMHTQHITCTSMPPCMYVKILKNTTKCA